MVDSRWVLRITDYGLREFKHEYGRSTENLLKQELYDSTSHSPRNSRQSLQTQSYVGVYIIASQFDLIVVGPNIKL